MKQTFEQWVGQTFSYCTWADHRGSKGKTMTTASFHLRNVYRFLKYMKEDQAHLCRLSQTQLTMMTRAERAAMIHITKTVAVHQLTVKAISKSMVASMETLRRCQELAKAKIPLLGKCA